MTTDTIMATTIAAGEFKAHCLKLLDEVAKRREPVVITKRGKPMAKLVPIAPPERALFGALAGSVLNDDDLVTPIGEDWHADR